ncbi:MAG TPA: transglycosylase SLT domain-containing protein [Burkholderiales bacterium]|nr:transglycosylase SLT domain-containing protein [Burkholderiales bacterium]
MTAKSAPQLRRVSQSPTPEQQVRGMLLLLLMALLMVGANWVLEAQENVAATGVASVASDTTAATSETAPGAHLPGEPATEHNPHRALSEFLSKRYKVSQAVTFDLVTIAHAAGQQIGVDPLLIIAVMAIESRFNPIAESVAGAKGLMQVIPKYHAAKFREFGGDKYAVFDPETNILVGSKILKEYIARTGSVSTALQLYVGSSTTDDDSYFGKVMNEKQRLQQVIRKAAPPRRPDVEAALKDERLALTDIL